MLSSVSVGHRIVVARSLVVEDARINSDASRPRGHVPIILLGARGRQKRKERDSSQRDITLFILYIKLPTWSYYGWDIV